MVRKVRDGQRWLEMVRDDTKLQSALCGFVTARIHP
jgi:hypothetical protein